MFYVEEIFLWDDWCFEGLSFSRITKLNGNIGSKLVKSFVHTIIKWLHTHKYFAGIMLPKCLSMRGHFTTVYIKGLNQLP